MNEKIRGFRANALIIDDYPEMDKEMFDEMMKGFVSPSDEFDIRDWDFKKDQVVKKEKSYFTGCSG